MTATAMALLYGASAGQKKATDGGGLGVVSGSGGGIRLRRVALLVLLICFLIPLLFLASPLIVLLCFGAVCLRRSSQGSLTREDLAPGAAEHHPRALLHRYLEDQLGLALAFGEEILGPA